MALKLSWSKQAGIRFDEIIRYLELEFGEKVANTIAQEVYHTLEILTIFPDIGTIENNDFNIRGLIISKQITLFYQIRTGRIILLNFYDNRQRRESRKY